MEPGLTVAVICFAVAALALVHSYILYPLLLKVLSSSLPDEKMEEPGSWPVVSVLLAVYNEEKVIRAKLESIFSSDYQADKLELVVGSDGSTDRTNEIIEEFISKGHRIIFRNFGGRTGKSGIINQISPLANGSIFIPTDANIFFEPGMIRKLVTALQHADTGLVSANIVNTGMQKDGISHQEEAYIRRENLIKYREGRLWGTMMGAFGACYAIRKELFDPIPANFLMEDFYITLRVIEAGYAAKCDLQAIAYEDVSNSWREEFKRKIRISAGNYQNLGVFNKMLWPFWKPAGFSFLSHKVLRWFGPFWLLITLLTSAFLLHTNLFWCLVFWLQVAGWFTPLLDALLSRWKLHTFVLRLLSYFFLMNLALLAGLWKYMKGIRTSAWNPTARNVNTKQ